MTRKCKSLRFVSLASTLLTVVGAAPMISPNNPWTAAAMPPADRAASSPPTPSQLQEVFARFKALQGTWTGRSTKGWTNRQTYTVMARGSAVLSTSHFKDAPEEKMATVIHRDGDRLLLTHYCEAGNQPRLVASSVRDGGRTVIFTFQDGTNLPSRDTGHMDKVIYRFLDKDNFTARWTWYQDGRENWLEEITYSRVRE